MKTIQSRRKTKRKIFTILFLVLLLMGGTVLWFLRKNQEMATAILVPCQAQSFSRTLHLSARVEPFQKVEIRSTYDQVVDQIYVQEGDRVQAGDVLLTYDREATLQAIEATELKLEEAKNLQAEKEAQTQAMIDSLVSQIATQMGVSMESSMGQLRDQLKESLSAGNLSELVQQLVPAGIASLNIHPDQIPVLLSALTQTLYQSQAVMDEAGYLLCQVNNSGLASQSFSTLLQTLKNTNELFGKLNEIYKTLEELELLPNLTPELKQQILQLKAYVEKQLDQLKTLIEELKKWLDKNPGTWPSLTLPSVSIPSLPSLPTIPGGASLPTENPASPAPSTPLPNTPTTDPTQASSGFTPTPSEPNTSDSSTPPAAPGQPALSSNSTLQGIKGASIQDSKRPTHREQGPVDCAALSTPSAVFLTSSLNTADYSTLRQEEIGSTSTPASFLGQGQSQTSRSLSATPVADLSALSGMDPALLLSLLQGSSGRSSETVDALEEKLLHLRTSLDKAEWSVRAPFDGLVAICNAQTGQATPDKKPDLILYDDHQLVATQRVGKKDAGKIAVGQFVRYHYEDLQLEGLVTYKAAIASHGEGALNELTELIPEDLTGGLAGLATSDLTAGADPKVLVKMSVSGPDATRVTIGFDVDCQIQVDHVENALSVPLEVLVKKGDQTYVYVVDEKSRIAQKPVTVGLMGDSLAEILSGLSAGDLVVTNTMSGLSLGQKVHTDIRMSEGNP